MNSVFPVGGVDRSAPPVKTTQASGEKFADHLDRTLHDQSSHNDKIGVRRRQEKQASAERKSADKNRVDQEGKAEHQDNADAEAAATLAFFMQDLRQVAENNGLGVGEWVASMEDSDFMVDMAAHAGMSELDLQALVENFQAADGSLDLASFFQSMQEHFEGFENNPEVLLPETDLPLLESLLAKMGMDAEQLAAFSDQAVTGDGQFDLAAFTEALMAMLNEAGNGQQILQPVTLSDAEVQQLQDLLGKTGLNLGEQLEMLPEPLLGKDVTLSLERLQAMLDQSVNKAQSEMPKIDLVAFLQDLESVMQDSTFVDQSAGITPLVQNSLVDAYKNLLDMFEEVQNRFDEGLTLDEMALEGDRNKWRAGVVERLAELTGKDPADIKIQNGLAAEGHSSSGLSVSGGEGTLEQTGLSLSPDQAIFGDHNGSSVLGKEQLSPLRHFPAQQHQQIMNQLSLAVARGMKSGEYHLTLRLHPAELGDVKVDLVMQGDEITAHFNMASSKVKETLESSMDDFRQDMEQKGFNLGEIHVSVGGQNDSAETWQRFEMAWSGERLQAETLEDLPDTIMYQQGMHEQYASQKQGVNLFV
jgi:flagellar hook-length control protein FliK